MDVVADNNEDTAGSTHADIGGGPSLKSERLIECQYNSLRLEPFESRDGFDRDAAASPTSKGEWAYRSLPQSLGQSCRTTEDDQILWTKTLVEQLFNCVDHIPFRRLAVA